MWGFGGHSILAVTRSRPRRRARSLARVMVPFVVLASVMVAGQMAADASTPTAMLGNTSATTGGRDSKLSVFYAPFDGFRP